jgi:hypothetical protein
MKENNKMFTIKKGQSIWLELKATEDTDLINCKEVCKIHFTDKMLGTLSSESIILKEDYFDGVRQEVMEDLTALLLENGFLHKRYLENKYCNGGGL